ncbi:hypothetical protein [Streptosporangium sp. KLBMP 9127]|nr:hypothetical protein [Streptosporangium sp. KLBMP 9127]
MNVKSQPSGCLTWPARVIAVLIVVPLRLLWEAVAAIGRALDAWVIRPILVLLDYVLVRPLRWLFTVLVEIPLSWLWRAVLTPVGRWLWTYVITPVGRAVGWALGWLLLIVITPFVYAFEMIGKGLRAFYRWIKPVLVVLGRVLADALTYAWGVATVVVRFIGRVLFHIVVRPVRWLWRTAVRPVLVGTGLAIAWAWREAIVRPAKWVHRNVLRPASQAVTEVVRTVIRAFGSGT